MCNYYRLSPLRSRLPSSTPVEFKCGKRSADYEVVLSLK